METPGCLPDPAFRRGRRVLLTGHTGFKGAWLAAVDADVTGPSLPADPGSLARLPPGVAHPRHGDTFHAAHGRLATVTAVRPPARWGALDLDGDLVRGFREKPEDGPYVNGGFFVLQPGVLDLIAGDATVWEREPMEHLAQRGDLRAFRHDGFWQPMDTLREKLLLEDLWQRGVAPWAP